MKQEDIDISVERNVLTVKGHRQHEYKSEDSFGGRRIERSYGSYSRSIRLPKNADQEHPVANFDNGVLNITFQKVQTPEPSKKIGITPKAV